MFKKIQLKTLGPGLFFAAAAIGASHLVQSTRAGALYGLGMIFFILIGLVTKYPSFRFGQQYPAITGVSLVEGFRRQGKWALVLYALIALTTVFPGLAAVSLLAIGLVQYSLGLNLNPQFAAAILIMLSSTFVLIGGYHRLDIFIKVLMVLLVITTIIATVIVLPQMQWSASQPVFAIKFTPVMWFFVATLVGWMPSPIDTCVIQSIWVVEKSRDLKFRLGWRVASIDFHIGYWITAITAFCFLILGAAMFYGGGEAFPEGAIGFSIQLIQMYDQVLGSWSKLIISISALAVVFSTMFVMLDGYSRAFVEVWHRFQGAEQAEDDCPERSNFKYLAISMLLLNIGAISVLAFFMRSFTAMLAIATTVSFVFAPVVALLAHRAMISKDIPVGCQMGKGLERFSVVCIVLLTLFATYYIYLLLQH